MNVKDIQENLNLSTGDRVELMIAQQKHLMEQYHHIEAKFRFTNQCPVDLDDSRGQLLLKDFAWRTTEEIAEALSALLDETDDSKVIHSQEEIADALHFLLEFTVLSGAEPYLVLMMGPDDDLLDALFYGASDQIADKGVAIITESAETIRQLGMVCHTLKNKPWKQTHMLTDKIEFYSRLIQTLQQFCRMSYAFGMGPEELFQMYFRKAKVNEFRQRSKY